MSYKDQHYGAASNKNKEAEDMRLHTYQTLNPSALAQAQLARAHKALKKKRRKPMTIAGTHFKGSRVVINLTKALIILTCAAATYQSLKDLLT